LSYVVSIRRDTAITSEELRAIVEGDTELTISTAADEHADDAMLLAWQSDENADPELFVLSQGAIDVTTPSNIALKKMQAVAEQLGAQVFGEEGEELTDVEVSDVASGGCGPVAWTILFFLIVVGGYWLIN
jgi:hypothetical protein